MHPRTVSRRTATSFILLLATLLIGTAILLPIRGSADPLDYLSDDVRDFGFQTVSSASQDSTSTDLRFAFSIGSLYYDSVGIVFSTTNPSPTAEDGTVWTADTVYQTITTGSGTVSNPGRWWVAVKLSSIPNARFEDRIYVRPFIKENGVYYYADTKGITVCEALTFDKTVAGESQIYNSAGHTGPYAEGAWACVVGKKLSDIRGSKHFYPTSSYPNGNDLWFEYSFLWNPTLSNWDNSEMKVISLRIDDSKHREFYYLYTNDNISHWCPYTGCFDCSTNSPDSTASILYGPDAGYTSTPHPYNAYPNVGQYGWHRLGVRFHQGVASVSGSTVTYSGYTELYVDGVKVWKILADVNGNLKSKNLLLFTATASGGSITGYADNPKSVKVQMRLDSVTDSPSAVYVAISDPQWTCGSGFVRRVSPVTNPQERTIMLGDTECSAKIWYVFDN